MKEREAKQEVIKAGKALVQLGLVARTWGNISCRVDDKRFVITPSGIGYEHLSEDNIVLVDIDTCSYQGEVKPSSETRIHADAYDLDPETNFVIHTHQIYASCISVSGFSLLAPEKEETAILGGPIVKAGYGLPGTKKLKENVKKALKQGSFAVLLESHGAVLTGKSRSAAFQRAATLEEVCKRASIHIPLSDTPSLSSSQSDKTIPENHKPFFDRYPEFSYLMVLNSPAAKKVMNKSKKLIPVLDDFAQMAGMDMKVCSSIPEAVRAIKGRNAVFVKGIGAICCAGSKSDCHALLTLVEKNAIVYLNALENGKIKGLSWLDKKLMRFIYTKQYSKRNKDVTDK